MHISKGDDKESLAETLREGESVSDPWNVCTEIERF